MLLSPERRAHSSSTFARTSRIEGGPFSKCDSRLNAAHTRLKHVREHHGLRAAPFQHMVFALAPRTLVLDMCYGVTDSHGQRTSMCCLKRLRTVRAQWLR
eukprot:3766401-Pyramimonas_sp.AAC.1